jgi:hypothetical protein
MGLSQDQKVFLVTNYLKFSTISALVDSFQEKFLFRPSYTTIRLLWAKFLETGSVAHRKGYGRPRTTRSVANVQKILDAFHSTPTMSLKRASQQLGLDQTAILRVLKQQKMKPYKLKHVQGLMEGDPLKR